MKITVLVLVSALFMLSSCAMITAWRSIPAPGGCEECHTVPISANWQVAYKAATLTDERGGESFQSPESVMSKMDKPATPLEQQKVEGLACFECHKSPDASHKKLKGRFHH